MKDQQTDENTSGADTRRPSLATYDPYMEEISDKIRRGEPVGFMDALAATEYQRQRKLQKPPTLWKRVIGIFLPNDQTEEREE